MHAEFGILLLAVEDVARAKQFYTQAFGWSLWTPLSQAQIHFWGVTRGVDVGVGSGSLFDPFGGLIGSHPTAPRINKNSRKTNSFFNNFIPPISPPRLPYMD